MSIKSTKLLHTTCSWDGVELPSYPTSKPELKVCRMIFPCGAKTGWHHHNVINYGIVEQGELTIVCQDGKERTFHQGEALVEVVGTIFAFPGFPNKPEQAYRLTANGMDLYKQLTGEDII